MTLNVLYIEDDPDSISNLEEAIEEQNKKTPESSHVVMTPINTPDDLGTKLNLSFDIILADVCYHDGNEDKNRIDDIIKIVRDWSNTSHRGRSLPIIALTGRGKNFVQYCLERKDSFYDIWDKNASSPEYRAWRLSKLSNELPRIRPDALIQRLISGMAQGADWHSKVLDMLRRYDKGLTEADQVERAGESVKHIAGDFGVRSFCSDAWDTMTDSEGIIRATCPTTRGHARHVLNVFWIGYFLIYHEVIKPWSMSIWPNLVKDRRRMGDFEDLNPLEALANIWFYVSIFHDFAYLIEKSKKIQTHHFNLLKKYDSLSNDKITENIHYADELPKKLLEYIQREFEDPDKIPDDKDSPYVSALKKICNTQISLGAPDHGLMSSLYFKKQKIDDPKQGVFLREASRSIALHSIICEVDPNEIKGLLSWKHEPLGCLLLLCDQLQTWDRERHDITYRHDFPERAELSKFEVLNIGGKPNVNISIDYIAPAHLEKSPDIFERVKDDLDRILDEHPKKSLMKISGEWPFNLNIDCTMSGIKMNTKINIPRR